MKALAWAIIGACVGLVAGLVLSDVIGIIGVLTLRRAVGIKFLPFYLAAPSAIAAALLATRAPRGRQ
jgi:hypothetical protein